MSRHAINVIMGMFVAIGLCLAGCGGGGTQTASTSPVNASPLTVTGTASEGRLITGKTVKLKDANGKSAVDATTDTATGNYQIDVSGLTAPFLVTVTGSNGTYVSLAQSIGIANINPITAAVVALASGTSDLSALFANLTPTQLGTIKANYTAKSAMLTTSIQAALPSGVKVEDYFTGTITAGKGMDVFFDTYQMAVNSTNGITIATKNAIISTVLTIPPTAVTANTSQPLPIIVAPTLPAPIQPPIIKNLKVIGAFNTIMLQWDAVDPNISGNVEIWRSKTNDLSTAIKIGSYSVAGQLYSDTPPRSSKLSETFYYWVRIVDSSNIEGPFNSNQGTAGSTASDPSFLLQTLASSKFSISMKASIGTAYNNAPMSIANISRVFVYKGIDYTATPIYDSATTIIKGTAESIDVPVNDCGNSTYTIYTTTGDSTVLGYKNAKYIASVSCGNVIICTNSPDISINYTGTNLEAKAVNTARLSCAP